MLREQIRDENLINNVNTAPISADNCIQTVILQILDMLKKVQEIHKTFGDSDVGDNVILMIVTVPKLLCR